MQVGNILSVSMILKDKERVRLFVFFFGTENPSVDFRISTRKFCSPKGKHGKYR